MSGTDAESQAAVAYNFGRAGQISNEQMRAISMVNDQFARNLTHTLGAWLRSQTQVVLAAGEQTSYSEFLAGLPEPSYVCLLRLEPLGGVGLLELNLSLAMTMVDLLLGGQGGADVVHEVTDIEDAILISVLEVALRELNAAWDTVGLHFALAEREPRARILRLMPGGERMLRVSFDVQMPGAQGLLNLCLPAVVLNTIHRRLSAVREQPRRRLPSAGAKVQDLMSGAVLRSVVKLPPVRLASVDLQLLTPGKVLELPLPKHTPAELWIGNVRVCSAIPVGKGEHRGALLREDVGGLQARPEVAIEPRGHELEAKAETVVEARA